MNDPAFKSNGPLTDTSEPLRTGRPRSQNSTPGGMASEENSERALAPNVQGESPSPVLTRRLESTHATPPGVSDPREGEQSQSVDDTRPDRTKSDGRGASINAPGSSVIEGVSGNTTCGSTGTGDVWIRGFSIAGVLALNKKTVHARALRESWPWRRNGNRFEYQAPAEIVAQCLSSRCGPEGRGPGIQVRFPDLAHSARARGIALLREKAVLAVIGAAVPQSRDALPLSQARAAVIAQFAGQLNISIRSLERWEVLYRQLGLDGLVEQKRGRVGRKTPQLPADLRRLGQALAHEHGSIARGARTLAAHPELPADCRKILHGAHASKSYVAPGIREQLRISPLTSALAQGPRAARLASPFTVRDWSRFKAGRIFTADDMTSNVLCWMEWPNKPGWIIRQAQVLAVMDVGSLRWLNVRAVVRESGQYTADDVWGLFGDVFDTFGLPHEGLLLEFGSWQSNAVKGEYTDLSHEERIGGLASLGLRIFPSFDPRSKGMLETMFNQLQHVMDRCPGWTGREQRYDKPEKIGWMVRECEAGRHHPREFFPHLKDLADHTALAMQNLNHERNDGQVLRGRSPIEKWAEDAPSLRGLPDQAKWLYRSACDVEKVTRNGITVRRGSGARMVPYNYFNPGLVHAWQGQNVIVYWNDKNPETDAVILHATKRTFLGLAQFRQRLAAFDATPDELARERDLKRETAQRARTELRSIQPDLQRGRVIVSVEASVHAVGREVAQASDQAASAEAESQKRKRAVARAVRNVEDDCIPQSRDEKTNEGGRYAVDLDELKEL